MPSTSPRLTSKLTSFNAHRSSECGLWVVDCGLNVLVRLWIRALLLTVYSRQPTAHTYLAHVLSGIPPTQTVPEALGTLAQSRGPNLAQAIALGEVFY